MVIPEYKPVDINGTKLAKIFRIPNVSRTFKSGLFTDSGDIYSSDQDPVQSRINFENVLNQACEGIDSKVYFC
jgi:hypothetical protein